MVNGKKKRLLILSIAVALVCAVAGGAVGLIVGLSRAETYKPFLDVKASEVSLGVERYQKWTFKREDGLWKFSNVSAYDGKKYVPLFTGGADGRFFEVMAGGADSLQLNPDITDFTVEKNAKKDKSIALSGERFTVRLFCDGRTPYVGREITIQSPKTGVVGENEINFCLKTPSETEAGENPIYIEQGYIASWGAEVEQKPLPYSFPAILSEFTAVGSPAKTFQFAQVVDYYRTGEQFKTARRKTDTQSGAVEVGLLGSRAQWETGAAYTVADWFIVRDASSRSFYDLIGDAARQYKAVNPMPLEVLAAKENRSVYEYDAAAAGLAMDIMDDRSLPLGKEGFFSPLAYKGLAGETFGGMDILRGMYQYALYTGDAGVLAYADEMDGSLTEKNAFGTSYIEKTDFVPEGLFINYAYKGGGKYQRGFDSSNASAGGDELSTWVYFQTVIDYGEVALLSGDKGHIDTFLQLVPYVRNVLRGPNYEQARWWNSDGTVAVGKAEAGGSAAMWAYLMTLASDAETDAARKKGLIEDAENCMKYVNGLSFGEMRMLRDGVKPQGVAWAVRTNVRLYELTGKKDYLRQAEETSQGIQFFYYHNFHPYTFFNTSGMAYAETLERWEAYLEEAQNLDLMSCLLKYSTDRDLLDLYYTAKNSHLWCLPINAYPDGWLSGGTDTIDATFVPTEVPTANDGDNPFEQNLKHSKDLYAAGEIFMEHQLYEAWGKPLDRRVTMVCYTAMDAWAYKGDAHEFRGFNAMDKEITTPLVFRGWRAGKYTVTADGKKVGEYTAGQLAAGIAYTFKAGAAPLFRVERKGDADEPSVLERDTSVGTPVVTSNGATLPLNTEGASHHIVLISTSPDFDPKATVTAMTNEKRFAFTFADSSRFYIRARGVAADGRRYRESGRIEIASSDVVIGAQEDFSSTDALKAAWTVGGGFLRSDINEAGFAYDRAYFTGYAGIYNPDDYKTDARTDTLERTFYGVNLSDTPILEIRPLAKNVGSRISFIVSVGGVRRTLLDGAETFVSGTYRYDLSLIEGFAGEKDVLFIIESSGFNRGFALRNIRFIRETGAHKNYRLTESAYTDGENAPAVTANGVLSLKNPASLPSAEVSEYKAAFNAREFTELRVVLRADVPVNTWVTVTVYDVSDASAPIKVAELRQRIKLDRSIGLLFGDYDAFEDGEKEYEFTVAADGFPGAKAASMNVFGKQAADIALPEDADNLNGWTNPPGSAPVPEPDGALMIYTGYGALAKTVTVDLSKTPYLLIRVNALYSLSGWSLHANLSGLSSNVTLIPDCVKTGDFLVDLKTAFNSGEAVDITLLLYVLNYSENASAPGGVKMGFMKLLESVSLVEDDETAPLTEIKIGIAVDLDASPYLNLQIANLTEGARWKIFVTDDDTGAAVELKSVYERAYGSMYTRLKNGAFIYDLRTVSVTTAGLIDGSGAGGWSGQKNLTVTVRLVGADAGMDILSMELANNNDYPVWGTVIGY